MTDSVLLGLFGALTWGTADFIARFTSRAMSHQVAMLGMLGSSAVIFTVVFWQAGVPFNDDLSGWWAVSAAGIGIMITTLLLYWGLMRGPVTIVAPISGSYPAINLLFAVALGLRPALEQLAAMLSVMAGVVTVAACAHLAHGKDAARRSELAKTMLIAMCCSFSFALTVVAMRAAAPIYGELQSILLMRWIAFAAAVVLFVFLRRMPVVPGRWWPVVVVQGVLDGIGYLVLLFGSAGIGTQIVILIGSCYSVVTVILARIFLREPMTRKQWAGVGMIGTGVAALSWLQ